MNDIVRNVVIPATASVRIDVRGRFITGPNHYRI
jgi:hypothetical protein